VRAPRKSRGDGIVELHQNDEADAPVGVDHREKSAESIKRLGDDDAAADGGRDVGRHVLFGQPRPDGISPASIERGPQKQDVALIEDQSETVVDESSQQRGQWRKASA